MKALVKIGYAYFSMSPEHGVKLLRLLEKADHIEYDIHDRERVTYIPAKNPHTIEMEVVEDNRIRGRARAKVEASEEGGARVFYQPAPRKPKQLNFHGNSAVV